MYISDFIALGVDLASVSNNSGKCSVRFQIDLRDDAATVEKLAKNKQKPLSLEMGEKLAKELRAVKYVECSALTQVRTGLNVIKITPACLRA